MSKHFSDIGKDSRDLISDDFPSEGTVKLTTQSKTPDGVTAKATLRRYQKGGREQVDAVIEPKYEWKEKNVEISGKLSTTNEYSANVVVKDLIKGSKIEFSGTSNEKSSTSKIVLSHKTDPAAAKITVTFPLDLSPKKSQTKINGDVVIQYPDNFFVGGNVSLDVNEKMGFKVEGVVGFTQNQLQVTGRGSYAPPPSSRENSTILWGASLFHKISENFKWALDFDTDHALKRGPVGVIACDYKVDNFTSVKGKCSVTNLSKPEARVALSAKQKVNSYLALSLGADLNVRNILSGDATEGPHSFGVEIKLQE